MTNLRSRLLSAVVVAGVMMGGGAAWAAVPTAGVDGPVIATAVQSGSPQQLVSVDPITDPATFGPPVGPNEATWASAALRALGLIGASDSVSAVGKQESVAGCGSGSCSVGNPTLAAFAYFIVKDQNDYYLFSNANRNALAEFGWASGVPSHVTFLTPIPAAVFLLLSAIGGLFGLRLFQSRPEKSVATA